jgi:hypothetical protein
MACGGYPPQDCPLTRWASSKGHRKGFVVATALPKSLSYMDTEYNHCDFYSGIMLYPGRLRVPMTNWCVWVVDEKGRRAPW